MKEIFKRYASFFFLMTLVSIFSRVVVFLFLMGDLTLRLFSGSIYMLAICGIIFLLTGIAQECDNSIVKLMKYIFRDAYSSIPILMVFSGIFCVVGYLQRGADISFIIEMFSVLIYYILWLTLPKMKWFYR